jgi:rubrerythrin
MLPIIATPKYDMIVPSTGQTVTYRPYVVKEEKILLIALESNDEILIEKSVVDIIKACIESPLKINDLTTFDIEYIFITLRSKSVGEGIKLLVDCEVEECDGQTDVKIDLDEIFVSNLESEEEIKNSKHIELNDDISMDLRWLKASDRLPASMRKTQTDTVINTVAKSIETIYSGEDIHAAKDATQNELVEFVESLNTDQFAKVLEFMDSTPALTHDLKYKCAKCGHEHDRELKGLSDFFI